MWPKLLLELLPHFTRLAPLADRYLSGRGEQDRANTAAHTAALSALGEEVRGGLGRVDEVHAGLQQALKEQSEQIAETGVEATRARMAIEAVEQRVAKLEQAAARSMWIAVAGLALMLAIAVMLAVVLVKLKAR